jgi:protein arginine kinase activator
LDGFRESGRLGCSNCYEDFRENVEAVLEKVQAKNFHIGKIPERSGGELKMKNEILCLKKKLKDRIKKEEFEEAALLRDKIRVLEKSIAGGGNNE